MKGDFSKLRFDAKKHFHGVLMQQGRVMLDSDWNEQAAINAYRTETGTSDIVGSAGAPMHHAGFRIQPADDSGTPANSGKNLKIFKGRLYVDGLLCENDADILFSDQPDAVKTPLPVAAGTYMFYLDVWQRHVSVLEDDSFREVALGVPDTTTRSKTIWQVKFTDTQSVAADTGINCLANLPASIIPLSTGMLSARSEQTTGSSDPCGLTASGGYRRLENQLYRVEIHTEGKNRAAAKFKWSRDNGSVAVAWEGIDTADVNKLIAKSAGPDELLGFRSGNWIELIDDTTDLLGKPGVMVQLSQVNGNVFTINPATIRDPTNASATAVTRSNKNPRIRRWDSDGAVSLNTSDTAWVKLEDGVEVKFGEGIYKTGDYWTIPARTAIADVEWPKDTADPPLPLPLPAHGVQHRFCKLALLDVDAVGLWTLKSDCRPLFPPITELTNLFYVGGDGQEAMPGKTLPAKLKVGVANGKWAVAGAKIKFELAAGGGSLDPADGIAYTNEKGIAQCEWTLGIPPPVASSPPEEAPLLEVKATMLDAADKVMQQQLPVIFNAGFSLADDVYYKSNCSNWAGTPPDTVADALDQLCERGSTAAKRGCSVTVGKGGDYESVDEAWEKLRNETNICICLLPGDHKTGNIHFDNGSLETLKITGCGATLMMFEKEFRIRANKVILSGFRLDKVTEPNGDNICQVIIEAKETEVTGCAFTCTDHGVYSKIPFVLISALNRDDNTDRPEGQENIVHLNRNIISVGKAGTGIALGLESGVEGWIESNRLAGSLVLFYDERSGLEWTDELRKRVESMIADDRFHFMGQLHIRGNFFTNIMTNVSGFVQQDRPFTYATLIVSENVFHSAPWEVPASINSYVSAFINLVNNQYTEPERSNPVSVVGKGNVVIGNIAANDNTVIHVFGGHRVGTPPPELNLVPVVG